MRGRGPAPNNGPGQRVASITPGGFPGRSAQRREFHQHARLRQPTDRSPAVQARTLRDHIQEVTSHDVIFCVTS